MGFLKKAAKMTTGGLATSALMDGLGGLLGGGAPSYDMDKAALTGVYDVESDLGGRSVVKNKDGTYSLKYTSSNIDKLRNKLAEQGLGALSLDTTDAQNAYYDQATRLLNDQYQRQLAKTDEALINRGIQTGTKQYNQVMGDVQNAQLGALSDIANQAVFQGQNLLGQQIGNINALTGARDINTVAQLGDKNRAYDTSYEAKQYQYNTKQNQMNNLMSTGASLAAMAMLSDKRAKENLKKVGALDNGLDVYVGNYKKETGLDTKPQLFLLAQEVKKVNPDAVVKKDGMLAVNYKKAVE